MPPAIIYSTKKIVIINDNWCSDNCINTCGIHLLQKSIHCHRCTPICTLEVPLEVPLDIPSIEVPSYTPQTKKLDTAPAVIGIRALLVKKD